MVEMATMAYQARLAKMERMAGMAGMVKMERLERWGSLASKAHLDLMALEAHLDLLAQAVEGWSTLAGDEQPAPTQQEQSWSMQEGLEELSLTLKEEPPTTFACQTTRTIYDTRVECKMIVQYMGLSIRVTHVGSLYTLYSITIYLALCVLP